MLSEEGLILLAAFGACTLVALGALELIWPTRPRHPMRRPAPEPLRRSLPPNFVPPRLATSIPARPVPARFPIVPPKPTTVAASATTIEAPVVALEEIAPAEAPAAVAVEASAIDEALTAAPASSETPPAVEDEIPTDETPAIVALKDAEASEASPVVVAEAPPGETVEVIAAEASPIETIEVVTAEASTSEPVEAVAAEAATADAAQIFSPPPLRIVPGPGRERAEPRRERDRSRGGRTRSGPRPLARQLSPEPSMEPAAAPEPAPLELAPAAVETAPPSVVERCFALLEGGRLGEVVSLGEEALAARKSSAALVPSPAAAQETARLWGAVGLAKQGLADFEGARFALEEAIAVAPRAERPTWERRLADLALLVGRQSLDEDNGPLRVDSLRSAIGWLERGLAVAPDDEGLREALTATRGALWPTYEAVVKAMVQRGELTQAREILDEVLAESDCPPDRRRALRRLYGGAVGAEVERVTEEALRHVQDGREDDATVALTQVESMIGAVTPETLSPKRRGELEHRLWTAYTTLGANRLEARAYEVAMNLLFRALGLGTIASERQIETRVMLSRALDEFVNERAVTVGRLIDAGDFGAATAQSDKLWTLLRGAVDQSLSEDDVLESFDKVLGLYRRMGGKRA